MRDIPIKTLHALLRLDADEGKLYWRSVGVEWFKDTARRSASLACALWNGKYAGKEAFTSITRYGYRQGRVRGRAYRAHRVIFAMHYGRWPGAQIDHRDLNKLNNRPCNIREATNQQNMLNRNGRIGSSQYCGVSWYARDKKWEAYANLFGRRHYLGRFSSEEAAARAYDTFAAEHHGEFARLNFPPAHKG